ncbi:hypothetical protein LCI18_008682 [Fusarium solani-melongenae]|uniref:Uncharacterized protein n=1 Tax=Fusarium solani subsp. cucurbitae TaxID=2747967 RepID=A0ACD3Z9I2_FUSSC|nr:hypothetical protein LCI18_008682 [Fusarium solani-melongenae]
MKFTSCISATLLAIVAAAEDVWTNSDGGNTHVDIGNKKVAYGYTPPWYAFDKIKEECPSNVCNSENKIVYATGVIQNGEMRPATITLAVEAGKKEYADQYTATDLIVVRVENEDGGLLVDMSVSIKVDVDDGGEGVCDTIMSVGSAIAGAINGLTGGAFSPAALACV